MARTPDGPPPPPVVQRVRFRYAKRGRLRFSSHRDFQRALERALRRSGVPMAFSAGFTAHPKVSYAGAAATGVASEAEYVELALAERVEVGALREVLDASLPPGLDVLEVVEVAGPGALADRLEASEWEVAFSEVRLLSLERAVVALLAAERIEVARLTKNGMRTTDARGPLVAASCREADDGSCAILRLVVRHVTPSVRPDDVLAAMREVADFVPPVPPRVTRLAQGPLDAAAAAVGDPLAADRDVVGVTGNV